MLTHEEMKARALADPEVNKFYENSESDVIKLDLRLRAVQMRKAAKLRQTQVAHRMHTTQQAVARLESPNCGRSPSMATYIKYATAVGCTLDFKPTH